MASPAASLYVVTQRSSPHAQTLWGGALRDETPNGCSLLRRVRWGVMYIRWMKWVHAQKLRGFYACTHFSQRSLCGGERNACACEGDYSSSPTSTQFSLISLWDTQRNSSAYSKPIVLQGLSFHQRLLFINYDKLPFSQFSRDMSDQVCKKLTQQHWRKYDTSKVPKKPGIYAIGEKLHNGDTACLYVGRSNNLKRRLNEHKTPTPQQRIDCQVAGRFQQHQKSKLRIKAVPEKRQKTLEGAYINGITKKMGYRPVLNMRAGDHSSSSHAGGHKRHMPPK